MTMHAMRRAIPSFLLILVVGAATALTAVLGLAVAAAKPQTSTPIDYSQATIGGLRYEASSDRPIDPSNPVDAGIVKGLPASQRRAGSEQLLLGVFVTVANGSSRPRPTAAQIDLRDEAGRVHHRLALPASDPYAYPQTTLAAGGMLPRAGTPPADNVAASGMLLLYRVSAWQYRNGSFELVLHDPQQPRAVRTIML